MGGVDIGPDKSDECCFLGWGHLRVGSLVAYGSSEGHFMLKRYYICRSIADLELIPKMSFLSKSVGGLFRKIDFCVRQDMLFH